MIIKKIFVFTLWFSLLYSVEAREIPLKLWYDKPSGETWEKALPIGNGFQGAMVYGNVSTENIQLNEGTVWTGSPNRNDNPNALAALSEIRRLIFDGKQGEAQQLAAKTMQSEKSNGQLFQPVGNLLLHFDKHDQFTNYYRELDLARAVTTTRYQLNNITYTREVFASTSARVIVVRLTADKAAALSFNMEMTTPQSTGHINARKDALEIHGVTEGHETVAGGILKFNGICKVRTDGGTVSEVGNTLTVSKANEAIIFVSLATNYNNYRDVSGNEIDRSEQYLQQAFKQGYKKLYKDHLKYYQSLFGRVSLDLGSNEAANKPTDVRLAEFAKSNDPALVSLYFQYGRYLLISCSQPGGQPANLQGLWNREMKPSWDSKYTININTEMNYWPAERTNLSEMHQPLFDMVRDLSETGKETARVMYGSKGWMTHHNTDVWRISGPVDDIYWGVWSMGGAWLCQHLWDHYLYSGDKEFLARVYPIIKGSAQFFADYLIEEPTNGWLVVSPGTSPENAPKVRPGVSFDAGTTMDNQIVFDIVDASIRAADLLGTDKLFADSLRIIQKRLPPMHIGQHAQLQEWLQDLDDPNDHHRHISHLYGLFPSRQLSPYRTPKLFSAANATLEQRGDISTGWSMGWKVNWWARMQNGNRAFKLIQNQLSPVGANEGGGGSYPNLFDAHPPFQIDGNFGCTSGIAEMLVQSHDGAVHILPALPDAWKAKGVVKGLKTIGGFTIEELAWENGGITRLVIRSTIGGDLRLRLGQSIDKPKLKEAVGDNSNPLFYQVDVPKPIISNKAVLHPLSVQPSFLYDMATKKGKSYNII